MHLGIDLGTSSVKALVIDDEGCVVARGRTPVALRHLHAGAVEQDLEEIWQATLAAAGSCVRQVRPGSIRSVGVSSQGGALQLLREDGAPEGPVVSWLDQRGEAFDRELTSKLGPDWFKRRILHGGAWLSIGQLARLRHEQPSLLRKPRRVGFVGDCIVERLCGRACHDGTSAALTLLYDPVRREYCGELLAELGLDPSQMPDLMEPGEPAGRLLPEAAARLGLAPGLPVSAAIHDQYTAALAAGAIEPGAVMLGTGTAWVLLVVTADIPKPLHEHSLLSHHVLPGLWGQILSMVNGGSAIDWGLRLTGLGEPGPEAVDRVLLDAPDGRGGLLCLPLLADSVVAGLPGQRSGALLNLRLHHGPAQVLRAIIEGLACEVRRHLDLLGAAGQPVQRLVLTGAAAASEVTPHVIAGMTAMPVDCLRERDASAFGAAMIGRGLVEPGHRHRAFPRPVRSVRPGAARAGFEAIYTQYLQALTGFAPPVNPL